MKWLISVPVWGDRYRENFIKRGLPSIKAAWEHYGLSEDIRFVLHTDNQLEMDMALFVGFDNVILNNICREIPPGDNNPLKLGNACRAALQIAHPDECVMFYNADMVISRETFIACERRFEEGKLFVTCHSVRTDDTFIVQPPIWENSRELLRWGWEHRHDWVKDCVYRKGYVAGPAIVVFEQAASPGHDYSVAAHCFSLQCLAVHKTREINFTGPTCDELVDCFTRDEVHVVTDPDELACIEPCAELDYDTRAWKLDRQLIIDFAPVYASPMMCWQFSQQITICGEPQPWAKAEVDKILSRIDQSKHPARLLPYSNQRITAAIEHDRKWRWPSLRTLLSFVPPSARRLIPKSIRKEILRWI